MSVGNTAWAFSGSSRDWRSGETTLLAVAGPPHLPAELPNRASPCPHPERVVPAARSRGLRRDDGRLGPLGLADPVARSAPGRPRRRDRCARSRLGPGAAPDLGSRDPPGRPPPGRRRRRHRAGGQPDGAGSAGAGLAALFISRHRHSVGWDGDRSHRRQARSGIVGDERSGTPFSRATRSGASPSGSTARGSSTAGWSGRTRGIRCPTAAASRGPV